MNGNSKTATEKQKLIQEKCLAILSGMLKDDDNKYCVDCDAKGPRWASWNLGVFLCIRCAGIHRNLGVHISKVKSVNLDTWKPEQAVALQQMGNSRARAVYEANLPDNFRRPQTDSALESFIRAKYEHNKYTAREWVPPKLPKVNWDAEIEATLREHRSAKKSGRGRVESPAPVLSKPLPAPAGGVAPAAPAPAPAAAQTKAKEPPAAQPASAAADLLGLDAPAPAPAAAGGAGGGGSGSSSADLFGDFLAAAPAPETNAAAAAAVTSSSDAQLASDEANFFSQPAAAAGSAAGSVMSRDSILALYGQAGGGGGGGIPAGGGGGMAGFANMPAASSVGGFASMPAASSVGGFANMPAASSVGGFANMPAASSVGAFASMPAAGTQPLPASYSPAQSFGMGYPAPQQQQQQQFPGLQQQLPQQMGSFQSVPYQQQQQQPPQAQPYLAGAGFGQGFPAAPVSSVPRQQGFPPQLHQQMAGLSMGQPQLSVAAPAAAPAGFPPMGAAPMSSAMGGQLWQ